MRRPGLVLAVGLAAAAVLGGCSDDDDATGAASTTEDRVSTAGTCGLISVDEASDALGVRLDRAVASEGTCTYTSESSRTAFTVQVADQGGNEPALVLETMGGSCDPDTRHERAFPGADGGFTCLAGGIPNIVAVAAGQVVVLTGNSQEEGVAPESVVADLATLLDAAVPRLES